MNAIAMLCLTYVITTTVRREDLQDEKYKKDSPQPFVAPRQIMYATFTIGFAVFVLVALNFYSKRYVIEMGVFKEVGANTLVRLVSPRITRGYREEYVNLSDISTTSLNKLQASIGTKKDGDYLYLKLRGRRSNLLLDLTTEHSYLDRQACIRYLSDANRLR